MDKKHLTQKNVPVSYSTLIHTIPDSVLIVSCGILYTLLNLAGLHIGLKYVIYN